MGKNKLSGSQNKKQAKEKEEKLKAVIDGSKKIDTFFCAQQKGFLIGAICNTFMIAAYLAVCINIGYSFTCGLIWPLESAHFLIKYTGSWLPITAPIKALQAITVKGLSIGSEQVYMGFLSIFGWSSAMIIALFILGIFKKDLWISKK